MHQHIARENIYNGHLQSVYDRNITINFIFTPNVLTDYSFIFEPKQMKQWWSDGHKYAEQLDLEGHFHKTD
jgi:hypothetical protein